MGVMWAEVKICDFFGFWRVLIVEWFFNMSVAFLKIVVLFRSKFRVFKIKVTLFPLSFFALSTTFDDHDFLFIISPRHFFNFFEATFKLRFSSPIFTFSD